MGGASFQQVEQVLAASICVSECGSCPDCGGLWIYLCDCGSESRLAVIDVANGAHIQVLLAARVDVIIRAVVSATAQQHECCCCRAISWFIMGSSYALCSRVKV
jgi:hypothetical protein